MATIKIDLGEAVIDVGFTTYDLYNSSPLGCHSGAIGGFYSGYNLKKGSPIGGDARIVELYKTKGFYRKLMDKLVEGAASAWGGWTSGGTHYVKKGHWILSAPWKSVEGMPANIGTQEIMDIISQFCDREPDKYGRYVMTDPSDCAAHGNNSGFPATRTMVWMPPYVGFSQNSKGRFTKVTGVWTPYVPEPEVPKAVEPPKQVEPAEIKIVDPIPVAKEVDNYWQDRYQAWGRRPMILEEQPGDIKRRLEFRIEKNRFEGPRVNVQNIPRNEVAKRRVEQTRRPNKIDMDALRRRHGGGWEQRYGNRAR